MNRKEKKLLNELKSEIKNLKSNETVIDTYILVSVENVKILLNYINKLQKEKLIEEKPVIKELSDKYLSVLEYNATLESEVKKWRQ